MCIASTRNRGGPLDVPSLGHVVGKNLSTSPKFTGLRPYGLRRGGISRSGAILAISDVKWGMHGFARYSSYCSFDCAIAPTRRVFPGVRDASGFHAMSTGTVARQEMKCVRESTEGGRRSGIDIL